MPISFPPSASIDDEYTFAGRTWVFNGDGWSRQSIAAATCRSPFNITPITWDYQIPGAHRLPGEAIQISYD